MKKTWIVTAACGLSCLVPTLASAKPKDKQVNEQQSAAVALRSKYDANKNGGLDSNELAKLQADYAAGKAIDAQLFDTNSDKKLDEHEIASLTRALKSAPAKKKKK